MSGSITKTSAASEMFRTHTHTHTHTQKQQGLIVGFLSISRQSNCLRKFPNFKFCGTTQQTTTNFQTSLLVVRWTQVMQTSGRLRNGLWIQKSGQSTATKSERLSITPPPPPPQKKVFFNTHCGTHQLGIYHRHTSPFVD